MVRPSPLDAPTMAQDVGGSQGCRLVPCQRLPDCGNGCRQTGQCFSAGLTSRLALHLGQVMRGEYIDKKENVLLIGNPGTGKTHLACALAFSGCAQGRKVRFQTATDLVTQLVECREERKLQRLHKQLQRIDLLLIDEMGYVPFSKTAAELLFEIISRAYEHHSIMLTTNLAFEQWTEIFGSERLTGALLDRLTHRCHIIEANGQSYRLRQARKTSKPATNQHTNKEEIQD